MTPPPTPEEIGGRVIAAHDAGYAYTCTGCGAGFDANGRGHHYSDCTAVYAQLVRIIQAKCGLPGCFQYNDDGTRVGMCDQCASLVVPFRLG